MANPTNTTRAPRALSALIAALVIGCAPIIAALLASASQVGK